jgi:ribose transport system substrate-binding protein
MKIGWRRPVPRGESSSKGKGAKGVVTLSIALVVLSALILAACGGSSSSSSSTEASSGESTAQGTNVADKAGGEIAAKYKHLVIGVASFTAADEGEKLLEEAMEEASELAGLEWEFKIAEAKGNPNLTSPEVESFVTQGVDAIVQIAFSPDYDQPGLEKAKDAGIPVFGMWTNGELNPLLVTDYTPPSAVDEAALSSYMLNELYENNPTGEIQLAMINTNVAAIQPRPHVLKGLLELYPRVKVVDEAEVSTEDPVGSATQITDGFLSKDPDLKAIWTNYPPSGVPAAAAVETQGKSDSVNVYMHIGDKAGVQALEEQGNPLKGMVLVDLDYQAYKTMEQMLLQLSGGTPSRLLSYEDIIPLKVFNKETAHEADGEGVAGGAGWTQNKGAWKQPMVENWKTQFGS